VSRTVGHDISLYAASRGARSDGLTLLAAAPTNSTLTVMLDAGTFWNSPLGGATMKSRKSAWKTPVFLSRKGKL
jgi:hypothetical protein